MLNAKQHEREATSSPGRARARSPSPPTWPAAAPTSCSAVRSKPSWPNARRQGEATNTPAAAIKGPNGSAADEVRSAGGLHIVGTERHESRRIDNQLRGRSGRQGDPGSSRFYLSLEDNLMRIFAADWVQRVMARMGLKEDDIIESPLVTKQIANAQRKVEAHNFDIRKNLLDFDDVNNDQRKVIYKQRDELLEADSVKDNIDGIRGDVVAATVERYVPANSIDEQWDLPASGGARLRLQPAPPLRSWWRRRARWTPRRSRGRCRTGGAAVRRQGAADRRRHHAHAREAPDAQRARPELEGPPPRAWTTCARASTCAATRRSSQAGIQERGVPAVLGDARQGQGRGDDPARARAVAQRVRDRADGSRRTRQAEGAARQMQFQHAPVGGYGADEEAAQVASEAAALPKVGRNEPCPCGSGKKYKHCHGQLA